MRTLLKIFGLIWIMAVMAAGGVNVFADAVRSANTEVELVSEAASVRPGEPFWAAIRMKMDDRWHVYWKNSGDSGLSPEVAWDLPDGFKAGEVHWPHPERMFVEPLMTYAHHGEIFLMVPIEVAADVSVGQDAVLKAHVDFLACELICVPGQADLQLALPVRNEPPVMNEWAQAFEKARQDWPVQSADWALRAEGLPAGYVIRLDSVSPTAVSLTDVYFFPDRNDVIDHAAPQILRSSGDGYLLELPKSPLAKEPAERLTGILVSENGWSAADPHKAIVVDAAVEAQKEGSPVGMGTPAALIADGTKIEVPEPRELEGPAALPSTSSPPMGLVIVFAFLGGLILNLMPCVLPVLSLKVLSFVNQARHDRSHAWMHGAAFSAGVIGAFWVLALLLFFLKSAGLYVGWGFQFQSPRFLVILAVLFFIFGLNLLGLFEIGTALASVGGKFSARHGLTGSFLNGILATVVATPCTAPFMGTAVGIALVQPVGISLLIFTFLGLGMAFPFLLLSLFPGLLQKVPRPGKWVLYFKKFLGCLLMATVIWLVWIFGVQRGTQAMTILYAGLFVLGLGFAVGGSQKTGKGMARAAAAVFIVAGALLAWKAVQMEPPSKGSISRIKFSEPAGIEWEDYSPELFEKVMKEPRPVFIDFTAAWCLSCQVNEKVALYDPQVVRRFRENNVLMIKADWTKRSDDISRALERYGKNSIPFYVLYGPDKTKPPIILPEILTPGIVMKALEQLDN